MLQILHFVLLIVLVVLIIFVSIRFCIYMYLCSKSEIKMFLDSDYDERIERLEKELEKLKEGT